MKQFKISLEKSCYVLLMIVANTFTKRYRQIRLNIDLTKLVI